MLNRDRDPLHQDAIDSDSEDDNERVERNQPYRTDAQTDDEDDSEAEREWFNNYQTELAMYGRRVWD